MYCFFFFCFFQFRDVQFDKYKGKKRYASGTEGESESDKLDKDDVRTKY